MSLTAVTKPASPVAFPRLDILKVTNLITSCLGEAPLENNQTCVELLVTQLAVERLRADRRETRGEKRYPLPLPELPISIRSIQMLVVSYLPFDKEREFHRGFGFNFSDLDLPNLELLTSYCGSGIQVIDPKKCTNLKRLDVTITDVADFIMIIDIRGLTCKVDTGLGSTLGDRTPVSGFFPILR